MSKTHTPGPWYCTNEDDKVTGSVSVSEHDPYKDAGIAMTFGEDAKANARLIAAAPELLAELQAAHQIIINALAVMTDEQKMKLGELNDRDGVEGEGVTRYGERLAVLNKATAT